MKTPAIASTFRHPLVAVSLLGVLLVFAAPVHAGDPDDDWGLPKTAGAPVGDGLGGGNGGSSSSSASPGDVAVHGEIIPSELDGTVAVLTVDRTGADGSGLLPVDEPVAAELVVAEGVARTAPLADGAQVQGDLLLRLGGTVSATLTAAEIASARAAFLVLEGGQGAATLGHLLDGALTGVVPSAVLAAANIGDVAELDVDALAGLVASHEALLHAAGVGHVSIVLLSRDSIGALHVAGARVPVAGGDVEVETR